jgi:2-acylglycerol O-acyltransferase 2
MLNFGEVDLYDAFPNPPGSKLRNYQEWLKRLTGIAPAKFIGKFGINVH